MWYVYVIQSVIDDGVYVGMSQNPEKRLRMHNSGMTQSTKFRRPFMLIYQELVGGRLDARLREKWLKSGVGREWIKSLNINNPG